MRMHNPKPHVIHPIISGVVIGQSSVLSRDPPIVDFASQSHARGSIEMAGCFLMSSTMPNVSLYMMLPRAAL